LGRTETAEPYRAERAHTYDVEILKTVVAKYVKMKLIVGEMCLAFALANENLWWPNIRFPGAIVRNRED